MACLAVFCSLLIADGKSMLLSYMDSSNQPGWMGSFQGGPRATPALGEVLTSLVSVALRKERKRADGKLPIRPGVTSAYI